MKAFFTAVKNITETVRLGWFAISVARFTEVVARLRSTMVIVGLRRLLLKVRGCEDFSGCSCFIINSNIAAIVMHDFNCQCSETKLMISPTTPQAQLAFKQKLFTYSESLKFIQ